MQTVMSVGSLVLHQCLYLVVINSQFDIEKWHSQFTDGPYELESWVEVRYVIDVVL